MNEALIDKQTLARNFSHAASTYDAWATAQARIAAALLDWLPAKLHPSRMIDLGCGTGMLSALLLGRYRDAALLGIDLAGGMVDHCRQHWAKEARAVFTIGDAEDPAHVSARNRPDLVACSSTSHWFHNPAATLAMWAAALAPGGTLAVASLVEGSLPELTRASQRAIGRSLLGPTFISEAMLKALAGKLSLDILHCSVDDVICRYADARLALRSFRQVGAIFHGQRGHTTLGPTAMRKILAAYTDAALEHGRVSVTFRVQYFIARKPLTPA